MYVIKHPTKGYLTEDEDVMGLSYSDVIDEYTVTFDSRENAERNCENDEVVVEI